MSIIHEALKKVEKSINNYYPVNEIKIPPQAPRPGRAINKYLIYGLIFCFGLFIENTFFLFILRPENAYLASKATFSNPSRESQFQLSSERITEPQKDSPQDSTLVTTQLASVPDAPSSAKSAEDDTQAQTTALVLNGIFFSQDDGYYALINNKIVKVGDDVNGAIVKHIDLDNVELESGTGLLVKLSRER